MNHRQFLGAVAASTLLERLAEADAFPPDLKITRIFSFDLHNRPAKFVGKNAVRGDHGQTSGARMARLHTNLGVETVGRCWKSEGALAPLLGKNPFHKFDLASRKMPGPLGAQTMVLWDLAGKVLKRPVYELLGSTKTGPGPVCDGSIYRSDLRPRHLPGLLHLIRKSIRLVHSSLCLLVLLLSQPMDLSAQAETAHFRVKDQTLHSINSRLFGQFMERPSWGEIGPEAAVMPGTHQLQPGAIQRIAEMNARILRFPGGTDVDYMDWCDMVDNVPGRDAERPVSTGHKGHKVTNQFGYDEFLQLCEALDLETIVVVNFRDALFQKKPLAEAARHAASLVAYCNAPVGAPLPEGMYDWAALRARNGHREPYRVNYFQIGNETWFFLGELKRQLPATADEFYVECLAAYIKAMRAVDPSIGIIIDGHGDRLATVARLACQRFGDRISHLASHAYTPWKISSVSKQGLRVPIDKLTDEEIWYAWIAVPRMDQDGQSILGHPGIRLARQLGRRVAMTEWNWNGWWGAGGQGAALNSSFAKGIGAAGYLHALMRDSDVIDIGCQSMLIGNGWGIHSIRADAKAGYDPYFYPSGQATQLYSKHHGNRLLAMETVSLLTYEQPFRMAGIAPAKKVAYVDALATADETAVYFHAINRRFDAPSRVMLDVSAFKDLTGKATCHWLEGRLHDAPKPGEPRQIARFEERSLFWDGGALVVDFPQRTVSCIEMQRHR